MNDEQFMRSALDEARVALTHDEVPIGCTVVIDDEIVAAAHNERELREDPTAHAEVLALRAAAERAGSWRLDRAVVYVTLEPCPMCAGAIVSSRAARLVYGAQDPKAGAALSLYNIVQDVRLNHFVELTTGVLAEDCSALLATFFASRRA